MASEKSFTAFLDVFFVSGGGGERGICEKHGSFFLSKKQRTGEKRRFFVCFLSFFCLFACLLLLVSLLHSYNLFVFCFCLRLRLKKLIFKLG